MIDQIREHRTAERVHATILFSDLRGFTAASFAADLEPLFKAVSIVLRRQVEQVQAHGGYIDKFAGMDSLRYSPGTTRRSGRARPLRTSSDGRGPRTRFRSGAHLRSDSDCTSDPFCAGISARIAGGSTPFWDRPSTWPLGCADMPARSRSWPPRKRLRRWGIRRDSWCRGVFRSRDCQAPWRYINWWWTERAQGMAGGGSVFRGFPGEVSGRGHGETRGTAFRGHAHGVEVRPPQPDVHPRVPSI